MLMHGNLLSQEEIRFLKFLKLKYRKGEYVINLFWRIGSPQEIRAPVFNLRKFEKTEKIIAHHVECIEIYSMTENLDPSNF